RPDGELLAGLNDSKLLTPPVRERLFVAICSQAVAVGVGMVPPAEIDRLNILEATRLAMYLALARLPAPPEVVLSDAVTVPGTWELVAVPRADATFASVAAASVVAKVVRDRYMLALDRQYPHYGFGRHKGYATPEHRAALETWGPSPAHRRSFLHAEGGAEADGDV
ncbi:MAG: ribonuclease HII, partial [Firmicutes bacterium]|nr:ribonuclease HII [Bacillota bacterium]